MPRHLRTSRALHRSTLDLILLVFAVFAATGLTSAPGAATAATVPLVSTRPRMCAGSSAACARVARRAPPPFMSAEAMHGGANIFISDLNTNEIDIYDFAGRLVGRLAGFNTPYGLAVDPAGTLYVADSQNHRIQVFSKGYNSKPVTLADPGYVPGDVAVDAKGNIAVINIIDISSGPGNIVFYAKGHTVPTKTISINLDEPWNCAFDASGNLYLDGFLPNNDYTTPFMAEIIGGINGTAVSFLAYRNVILVSRRDSDAARRPGRVSRSRRQRWPASSGADDLHVRGGEERRLGRSVVRDGSRYERGRWQLCVQCRLHQLVRLRRVGRHVEVIFVSIFGSATTDHPSRRSVWDCGVSAGAAVNAHRSRSKEAVVVPRRFIERAASALALFLVAGCSGSGGAPSLDAPRSAQTTQRAPQDVIRQPAAGAPTVVKCRTPPGLTRALPAIRQSAVRGFVSDTVNAAGGATIFVSDSVDRVVYIYGQTGKLNATLDTGAYSDSLAVDELGNLYVPDTGNARVLMYAKGYGNAPAILADSNEQPSGVAVDLRGNLAVANYQTVTGAPGNVAFYAKGQLRPTKIISSKTFQQVYYAAFDASGNLYVDGENSACDNIVGEIVGGIHGTSITPLETDNSLNYGGAIQVDRAGDIVVDGGPEDGFGGGEIRLFGYAPPKSERLGAAKFVVNLLDAGDGFSFAFDPTDAHVWTADEAREYVQQWNFPAGGFALDTWQNPNGNQALAIAVAPSGSP